MRQTPLRPRTNDPRRRVRQLRRQWGSPAYRQLMRYLPCLSCKRLQGCDPAHLRARGMGGAKGGYDTLAPLCRTCHRRYDEHDGEVRRHEDEWLRWARWLAQWAETVGLIAEPVTRPELPVQEPPRWLTGRLRSARIHVEREDRKYTKENV